VKEEILTESVKIISDDMPSFLEERVAKPIRPRGLIQGQIQNYVVYFFPRERQTEVLKIWVRLNNVGEVKLHISLHRESQSLLELLEEKGTFLTMISDQSARAVQYLSNNIKSISLSGQGMEEFSVFITKLHHTLSIPLLPIFSLHAEQITNMCFNDISETEFMREEGV
jgi:hypothetical protein